MMPTRNREALVQLLLDLQRTVQSLFVQRSEARGPQRALLQRRLLLGLELLWKLEEQVVMPALQDAEPAAAPAIVLATREIETLRDLALRVVQAGDAGQADVAAAALEGVVHLHGVRSGKLLVRDGMQGVDWRALHKEVLELLSRWREEVHASGDIEDEERDPVGLAPR